MYDVIIHYADGTSQRFEDGLLFSGLREFLSREKEIFTVIVTASKGNQLARHMRETS